MKLVYTKYSKNNPGHYAPGMVSGHTLYISGQLSKNPATGEIPGNFREEALQALKNMEMVLHEAGLDRSHVVLCRIYITSADFWGELNDIYAEWFDGHKPARAVVPVPALHYGCNIEIEATAEFPASL